MKNAIIIFALIVSFAIVGDMDYNSHVADFKAYCSGVEEGIHPDYENTFDKCGE